MREGLARARALPYVLLLVAAASFGGNWVAARLVNFEIAPFALSFWRWAIAAALLFPFALRQLREDAPLIRAHLPKLFIFGAVGAGGFTLLGYWGVSQTTAINATLLNSSLPLFVVPLSWLLLGLTVSARQLLGLALSLAGVVSIVSGGDLRTLAGLRLNPGDFLILGGAFLWAVYTVTLKWRPPLHALSFLFTTIASAALVSFPFFVWEMSAGRTMTLTPTAIATIAYLSIFPSIVAYVCWNYAVAALGPNVVGFFNPVIPVFGILFAVILLGEPLRAYHLAGFALVLAGVVLTSRR
ncbi:MAG TPA: DMT family transporter [Burkholderiales bacterium]|nr:DMT family transporter [Burkholderiales bacterium]HYA47687.1 DMT family transporter [Burkholderiales bacterium]